MNAQTQIRSASEAYRPDPKRPGYCTAWRINYRRERDGRITRCQDGERVYAYRDDAVLDARRARRDAELDRLYGPLIVEVCEIATTVEGLAFSAIHAGRS